MGRELKRVPLDFDWPLGKVWRGYVRPDDIEASETWTPTDPPIGGGYQLWETTSEGSPKSPVFATLDELCAWCETNATTFGDNRATAEQWREMLDDGFVCHREGNVMFV